MSHFGATGLHPDGLLSAGERTPRWTSDLEPAPPPLPLPERELAVLVTALALLFPSQLVTIILEQYGCPASQPQATSYGPSASLKAIPKPMLR